jgi:hypothetical protein
MATNRDVQDFVELRHGFLGLVEFADAALRFLDKHGIGLTVKRKPQAPTNGNSVSAFRDQVRRTYATRRQAAIAPQANVHGGDRKGNKRAVRQQAIADWLQKNQTYKRADILAGYQQVGYPVTANTLRNDLHALGWQASGMSYHAQWAYAGSSKRKTTKTYHNKDITKQRRKTAAILKRAKTKNGPLPPAFFGKTLPILLRHGYLAKQDDGYVATDKEFVV